MGNSGKKISSQHVEIFSHGSANLNNPLESNTAQTTSTCPQTTKMAVARAATAAQDASSLEPRLGTFFCYLISISYLFFI